MMSSDLRWVIPSIVLVPLAYTYLLSALTSDPTQRLLPHQSPEQISIARKRRDDRRALEARRRRISRMPFPLLLLPMELRILIIEYCADSPGCFGSLVRVSKEIQRLAYTSCLPLVPIRLIDHHQVESFSLFLENNSSLAKLINHLWVTPLHEVYVPTAISILKQCTNIISLACTARMLQDGVTSAFLGYMIRHTRCTELTLLYTTEAGWTTLLHSPSVLRFLGGLRRLRLVGERVPANVPFPNLHQISFAYNPHDSDRSISLGMSLLHATAPNPSQESTATTPAHLSDAAVNPSPNFPSLQCVILVRERSYASTSVRIWRKPNASKVHIFEIPAQRTELDLWCENALGRGFWALCNGM